MTYSMQYVFVRALRVIKMFIIVPSGAVVRYKQLPNSWQVDIVIVGKRGVIHTELEMFLLTIQAKIQYYRVYNHLAVSVNVLRTQIHFIANWLYN